MIKLSSSSLPIISLLLPMSFIMTDLANAEDYDSLLSRQDTLQYCNIIEVRQVQTQNGFDNRAVISQTYSQQQVKASNTSQNNQSISSNRQRNCSTLLQADTQRYIIDRQTKTQRYLNDTNLRQGLLGNMLKW